MEMISTNRSKIEYYDSLLEDIEEKLINLKLEKNKIENAYNKNKKRIENLHIAMNVFTMVSLGVITSNIILTTNMIEILIVTASLCGVILEFVNKMISGIYKSNNNIKNIDTKTNEFKQYELEEKKKEIEDILVMRNFLNNILENKHIFNFEKEEVIDKIISENDKALDNFNIDELNAITFYLQQLEIESYSYDVGTSIFKISNTEELEEKGYQKTLK